MENKFRAREHKNGKEEKFFNKISSSSEKVVLVYAWNTRENAKKGGETEGNNKLLPPFIQIQSELILREGKYLLNSSIKEEAAPKFRHNYWSVLSLCSARVGGLMEVIIQRLKASSSSWLCMKSSPFDEGSEAQREMMEYKLASDLWAIDECFVVRANPSKRNGKPWVPN